MCVAGTCRAEVELKIDEFNAIGSKVPLLANLKPHGKVTSCHVTVM